MKPLITVFTPAYNRAGTLPDLYESLCRQTCFDFEWVIVDDDSSDNTKEVVNDMICGNTLFDISYYKQEHGGKHRAVNKGVSMAKGDYFFIVDSDDYLLPDAIRLIKSWVEEIGDVLHLAGVSGLRQYPDGTIVGEYPWKLLKDKEWIEADNTKRYINKLMGDKAEVYKTGLLKDHPFAEFDNEYFLTESTCWNKLASEGFSVRWYPVPIYVCEYQEGGLTKSGANSFTGHIKNKQGYNKKFVTEFSIINHLFFRCYKISVGKEIRIKYPFIILCILYKYKLPKIFIRHKCSNSCHYFILFFLKCKEILAFPNFFPYMTIRLITIKYRFFKSIFYSLHIKYCNQQN